MLQVVPQRAGSPKGTDAMFLDQPLQYPSDLPKDVHFGINQVLNQIATMKGIIGNLAPAVLVLSVLPYTLLTETDAVWVDLRISEWDATIDLAPFFNREQPNREYKVKAVVYHLHPAQGPVNLNSGHYVAYVRQAGIWHLANVSSVRPVLMSWLRGIPYLLVLERTDAPG